MVKEYVMVLQSWEKLADVVFVSPSGRAGHDNSEIN